MIEAEQQKIPEELYFQFPQKDLNDMVAKTAFAVSDDETRYFLNGIYLEDYIDAVLDRGMSWETVLEKYLHWTKTPRRPNVTVLGCSSGVEPPFDCQDVQHLCDDGVLPPDLYLECCEPANVG